MKTLTLFFLLLIGIVSANGATFTVNTNLDNESDGCGVGLCTLREAINAANNAAGANTIDFSVTGTINLTSILPNISQSVTIAGPGARILIVQRSTELETANFRIFRIAGPSETVVNIRGITIANGNSNFGAGIRHDTSGNTLNLMDVTVRDNDKPATFGGEGVYCNSTIVNITRSTFIGNEARDGGGVNVNANCIANISNSTFSSNTAEFGGGIISFGLLTLNNVTISHNTSIALYPYSAGGISSFDGGAVYVRNSIIANNTGQSSDIYGNFISHGNNLIGKGDGGTEFTNGVNGDQVGTSAAPLNPLLGPLQNNGGQTDTRELLDESPAIDAGNNCVVTATCPSSNPSEPLTTDQRGAGFDRLAGLAVDIGAFEVQTVDTDNDGISDNSDNCPLTSNADQLDTDGDSNSNGNACDTDDDNDGVLDTGDNCPLTFNPDQADFDRDGIGDTCDSQTGPPLDKEQCKNGGWTRFDTPRRFRNQGDCIQFVNTGQ